MTLHLKTLLVLDEVGRGAAFFYAAQVPGSSQLLPDPVLSGLCCVMHLVLRVSQDSGIPGDGEDHLEGGAVKFVFHALAQTFHSLLSAGSPLVPGSPP